MGKAIKGDGVLQENTQKVTSWINEKVLPDTEGFLRNLDRETLESLDSALDKLNDLRTKIKERIEVRRKQSPHYQAALKAEREKQILDL